MPEEKKDFYNEIKNKYFGKIGCLVMPDRLIKIRNSIKNGESEELVKKEIMDNIPYIKF